MAWLQFPRDLFVRVLETNESASMGGYQMGSSTEIDQILVWLNVEGTPGGSETMQVEVYGSLNTDVPLYTSDVVTMSDIDFDFDPDLGDWIGVVPFNFNRETLASGQTYYLSVKMDNYTRNGDTYYVGYVFDNPEPAYGRITVNQTAGRALIIGFE